MRSTLLIRVGQDHDDTCQWLSLDGDGNPLGEVRSGTLTDAAAEANGLRVLVLVPGIDCLISQVTIPGRNRQKLLRAVPFAMEEQLTDDVEDLHFAVGPELADGANPVVVIAIRHMDAILERLREAGLEVNQLIPELLAIPCPEEGTCAVIDGDMALVRSGPYSGFAVDADNLGLLLASQPDSGEEADAPVHVQVPAVGELPDLSLLGSRLEMEPYHGEVLELLAEGLQTPAIDLLQGAYSRSQEWGRIWQPWRATAALLLAGILLSNVVMGVEYFRLSQERDDLAARIEDLFKQAFPETRRIVNPRVQMEQQLEQLQRRHGAGSQFMTLLARSGDILRSAEDIEITGANYRAGRIDVDLTAANLQVLDKLKQTLSGQGLSVEIQSATTDESQRVKSRLRIQGSSA